MPSHNHQDQLTKSYPVIQIIQIISIPDVGTRRHQRHPTIITNSDHQDQSTKSSQPHTNNHQQVQSSIVIRIIQIITIYNIYQPNVTISITISTIINQCQTLTQSSHIWTNQQCNSRHSKIINSSNHAILALEFRLWIFNRHFSKSCSQTYPTPLSFCLTKWFVFKQAHQQ